MKRLSLILGVLSIIACGGNKQVDVAGITPSPFVGCWECVGANDSIQNLSVCIGERGDLLLLAAGGVCLSGARIQMPEIGSDGNYLPQAHLLVPTCGNKTIGRFFMDADCGVTLELFSNNTLLFKTAEKLGF